MEYLRIETSRDAYGADDCIGSTMTVGQLMEALEGYDEETPIVLSFDRGYTYGKLTEYKIDIDYTKD